MGAGRTVRSGQVRSGQNSMWNWDREMRNIVGDKILYREIRMASSNVKIPEYVLVCIFFGV